MQATALIELLGFLAAFCTTTAFLPQAIKILHTKQTQALSVTMLSLQFTGTTLWAVYGFLILSPSLIVANILTSTLIGVIIILKWHYETKPLADEKATRARLRWACRRGMLELDRFLLPVMDNNLYEKFSPQEQQCFQRLLTENDQDLYAWFLGQRVPDDVEYQHLCQKIKTFIMAQNNN